MHFSFPGLRFYPTAAAFCQDGRFSSFSDAVEKSAIDRPRRSVEPGRWSATHCRMMERPLTKDVRRDDCRLARESKKAVMRQGLKLVSTELISEVYLCCHKRSPFRSSIRPEFSFQPIHAGLHTELITQKWTVPLESKSMVSLFD